MKNGTCGMTGMSTPITPRMKKKIAHARFLALLRDLRLFGRADFPSTGGGVYLDLGACARGRGPRI